MKNISITLAMALVLLISAVAGASDQFDLLGKIQNLESKVKNASTMSCVPDGLDCTSTLECCGASSCWQGRCNGGGPSCGSVGATCRTALDCCGSLSCWQGRCDGGGPTCYPKGALCKTALDCCGALSCWQGRCD